MQDRCGVIRRSAATLLAVSSLVCAGESCCRDGSATCQPDLEKVCHFVSVAFLCFQRFTRTITRHGVSLNLVIASTIRWLRAWLRGPRIGLGPAQLGSRKSTDRSVCATKVWTAQRGVSVPPKSELRRQECLSHKNRSIFSCQWASGSRRESGRHYSSVTRSHIAERASTGLWFRTGAHLSFLFSAAHEWAARRVNRAD